MYNAAYPFLKMIDLKLLVISCFLDLGLKLWIFLPSKHTRNLADRSRSALAELFFGYHISNSLYPVLPAIDLRIFEMVEFLLPMKGSIRQRSQSFGDRRLLVRLDNLRTSSPVPPLIAFIGKDDDLPADWMPLKARKRSADDIILLQKDLRRLNGIDQPGEAPAR